jgi:hypothetical protein
MQEGSAASAAIGWTAPRLFRRTLKRDHLNRRAMMGGIISGAAVVGVSLALRPAAVEAMPIDGSLANAPAIDRRYPVEHSTLAAWQ